MAASINNTAKGYSAVLNASEHSGGKSFSIEEEIDEIEDEEDVREDGGGEEESPPTNKRARKRKISPSEAGLEFKFDDAESGRRTMETEDEEWAKHISDLFSFSLWLLWFSRIWSLLSFSWMRPLLEIGNMRRLEPSDLGELDFEDSSNGVYIAFKEQWRKQLKKLTYSDGTSKTPSLAMAYLRAFGFPFFCAGGLKFVHDCCLFAGPLLLNRLILFLSNPSLPTSVGMYYVLGLFAANTMMSLCLRQYFFWCFRVGMRLRSAVVTSVYAKSLVLSAGALGRKSVGEITNLMAVDSTRLQELTPYLHAVWYSFFQIAIALVLLWQQVGSASIAAITVIILTIPLTGRVSVYLKTIQKKVSSVRDERVKICNEVLAGMKVIKLQSWEVEFQLRINAVRDKELVLFRQYVIMQSLSGKIMIYLF